MHLGQVAEEPSILKQLTRCEQDGKQLIYNSCVIDLQAIWGPTFMVTAKLKQKILELFIRDRAKLSVNATSVTRKMVCPRVKIYDVPWSTDALCAYFDF